MEFLHVIFIILGILSMSIGIRDIYLRRAAFFDDGLEGFQVHGFAAIVSGLLGVGFGMLMIVAALADVLGFTYFGSIMGIIKRFLDWF